MSNGACFCMHRDGAAIPEAECSAIILGLSDSADIAVCRHCDHGRAKAATVSLRPQETMRDSADIARGVSDVSLPIAPEPDPEVVFQRQADRIGQPDPDAGNQVAGPDRHGEAAQAGPPAKTELAPPYGASKSTAQILADLSRLSGVSAGTAAACFYRWKNGKPLPNGPKARELASWMDAHGVIFEDIERRVDLDQVRPLATSAEPCVPARPASLEGRSPAVINDLLDDPASPAPPPSPEHVTASRSMPSDEDPDEPPLSLDPIAEAARYGISIPGHIGVPIMGAGEPEKRGAPAPSRSPMRIEIPEYCLREPTFEEALTAMKRRLPVGASITITL